MSALTDRLASLKSTHNHSVKSKDKTPTPLWVFLYIYTQASHECYINYMEGAEKLHKYLAPIAMPTHTAVDENYAVPDILRTYEMTKLAELLIPKEKMSDVYLAKLLKAERAILYSMYKEVIPLMY